jgi:predicted lipoprotein with Yx(FWY)xxD motif
MYRRLLMTALAVVLAGCGGQAGTTAGDDAAAPSDDAATTAPSDEAMATEPAAGGEATVAVASSSLGDILVDAEGMSLYVFLNDEQGGSSTCYDDCESAWPPLVGPAAAGDGADESLLSTTEREDGTQQVTYNGWPLYYYAADTKAGDTTGQGVGDVWFAVDPAGEAVKAAADKPEGGMDY